MKNNRHILMHKAVFTVLGIFIIVLIAAAVSGSGLLSWSKLAQTNPSQQQGEIKEFINENGYIELKPTGDKKLFTKGSQESLDIIVTHPDKQTVGYNIPLHYDGSK